MNPFYKHIISLLFVCISISNTIPIQSFHECNHLVHQEDGLALHESHDECIICDHIFKQASGSPFSFKHTFDIVYYNYTLPCSFILPEFSKTSSSDRGPPISSFS